MADDLGPGGRFREAPQEVQRYFRAKESVETFDWRDLWGDEHAFAFTVAKSAGYDILDDIRQALDEAITKQQPFHEFQRSLVPTLQRKGWWGKAEAVDPLTGETMEVQLGSTRRLKTIFWANTRTARAAGEWERTWRTRRSVPFLRYLPTRADEPRKEHEAWVGTILPIEHPWWRTHYPPNGWGCQCGVEQISNYKAEQLGYDPAKPAPPLDLKPWTNRRTGEVVMVPAGIDPGWATNPGAARAENLRRHLAGKLEGMTPAQRRIAVEDMTGSDAFRWVVERGGRPDQAVPVGVIPAGKVPAPTPASPPPAGQPPSPPALAPEQPPATAPPAAPPPVPTLPLSPGPLPDADVPAPLDPGASPPDRQPPEPPPSALPPLEPASSAPVTPGTTRPATVWLNGETAARQRETTSLSVADYAVVQSLLEGGVAEVFRATDDSPDEGALRLALSGRDGGGRLWRAVLRLALAGTEWWLHSLLRVDGDQPARRRPRRTDRAPGDGREEGNEGE
jgi:hypothetical protein